jgi:protein TonB
MLAAVVALALAQAEPAPAPAVLPPPGRDWWTTLPPGTLPPVFPAHAWIHHIAGSAVVTCEVKADSTLIACRVAEEKPRGEEFGKAALKMTTYYRARPLMRDGQPVDGGVVRIPITFGYR